MHPEPAQPDWIIVTAADEERRLPATLTALRAAFPAAGLVVADDGSRDASAQVAAAYGAEVVPAGRRMGKGGAATLAARWVLSRWSSADGVVLLCDADLGDSAGRLTALVDAVARGDGDVAVAQFVRRTGGGLGVALGFARFAVRRRCGLSLQAPISGQRALRRASLHAALPFARGYGMEIAMTIDLTRAGHRVVEVPIDLEHRATGRTLRGFAHRARQLVDFVAIYVGRRRRPC